MLGFHLDSFGIYLLQRFITISIYFVHKQRKLCSALDHANNILQSKKDRLSEKFTNDKTTILAVDNWYPFFRNFSHLCTFVTHTENMHHIFV